MASELGALAAAAPDAAPEHAGASGVGKVVADRAFRRPEMLALLGGAARATASTAGGGELLSAQIRRLKEEQQRARDEKKRLNKDLKNAQKRKRRLQRRARQLTDIDLLDVLRLRHEGVAAEEAAAEHASPDMVCHGDVELAADAQLPEV